MPYLHIVSKPYLNGRPIIIPAEMEALPTNAHEANFAIRAAMAAFTAKPHPVVIGQSVQRIIARWDQQSHTLYRVGPVLILQDISSLDIIATIWLAPDKCPLGVNYLNTK